MKTIKNVLLGVLAFAFLLTTNVYAQEETAAEEEFSPVYLTITTGHWSSDPDIDFSEWKETEVEYFNKVTSKNDLIIGSGYYTHQITDDSSEIIFVSVYKTWGDIEAAGEVTQKLIEEGWPDEAERTAFFEKQNSYYDPLHSDEIYASTSFSKPLNTESTEPLLFYVRKNKLSYEGDREKFKEYFDNVLLKNDLIKGIWTHRHRWGSNSTEFQVVQAFESMSDFDKSWEESQRLMKEYIPDEDERKAFWKEFRKLFTGHGDALYENVPELEK